MRHLALYFSYFIQYLCVSNYYNKLNMKKLTVAFIALLSLSWQPAKSAKIRQLLPGEIFLANGQVERFEGGKLLSAPHAKDPMLIVVNPYSKNQEKIAEYAPADIDSIVVWPRSNSAVRLTFVFLKKYGWAMKIDQSQKYDVYQFASKGYGLLGSTCRWFYGDSKLLVGDGGKDGKFGEIKAPSETSPEKFTKQIAKLCPDDEPLQQRLLKRYGHEYTDNQVVVTFENGDTIEGYLRKDIKTVAKNMFSSLGGSTTIPKFINISYS